MENISIVIGICGVTCAGKTTLASNLDKLLHNVRVISQDDYFLEKKNPKHTWVASLNHINYDVITSLNMEKLHCDANDLIKNSKITESEYNKIIKDDQEEPMKNNTQNFPYCITDIAKQINEKIHGSNIKIVIIEGFCIFNYPPILPVLNLKYYFTLTKKECFKRRVNRHYDPPDCPGYFEECAWPEHVKQLEEVRSNVPDVKYFGESSTNVLEQVLIDTLALIEKEINKSFS